MDYSPSYSVSGETVRDASVQSDWRQDASGDEGEYQELPEEGWSGSEDQVSKVQLVFVVVFVIVLCYLVCLVLIVLLC